MGFWEAIVVGALIVAISGTVQHWMKQKRLIAQAQAEEAKASGGGMAGQVPHLLAEVDRLKDRVAVLEKVVTDPSHRLAAEIDGLRLADRREDRSAA
jgi:ubiquinone biosynthesis protein UbiJ